MPRLILLSLLALDAFGSASAAASPDDGSNLIDRLIDIGFENVAVRESVDETVVWYENRVFRYEMTGLGVVAAMASEDLAEARTLTLVPQNLGLPLLSVSAPAGSWRRLLAGEDSADTFRTAMRVGPGRAVPADRRHRPLWKADLALRPLFAFELGRPTDVFQYSFAIAPEATLSPFGGSLLTAQVIVRLKNDLDPLARDVSPGRSTVTWAGWLPGRLLLAASAGILPPDRYGIVGEIGRLLFDGHLELAVGGDLTGLLAFQQDVTLYSSLDTWSAFVAATGRTPGVDLEVRVSAARYMEGDFGGRVDVARRYHEARVGFFGIKTESETVGGMVLTLPLPVKRQLRPRRVRPITVPSFPIVYRDKIGNFGLQVSHFNDIDWVRKGLFPTFVRTNIADVRTARRYLEGEE